ncbi:MAG: M23 family metallopeptidase [Microthrixaceae bacterium]
MKPLVPLALTCLLAATACSSTESSSTAADTVPARLGQSDGAAAPEVTVPDAYTSVVVNVSGDATAPFLGTDGRYHVAYDLQLTNTSGVVPATLDRLEVVDAERPDDAVATFEGDELVKEGCDYGDCNRLRNLAARPADDTTIPPQEGRILFVDYAFDSIDEVPRQVLHHLFVQAAAGPPAQEPSAVDYLAAPYVIDSFEPKVVGPPLEGRNWVALNGCCEPGFPHRSSPAPFNGRLVNGQRFAIDWKRMNDEGAFFEGDPNTNEHYVDYGADVLAVADATVVTTLDGMEANQPGVLPANDPKQRDSLTVENVDGNHIVLDLGDGTYAFYAHLQAGSLKVKEGDVVTRGQQLAALGNTGNANASHLHFHLMDGPSVLGSNGLPFVIDTFDFAGAVEPQQLLDTDDYLSGTFNGGLLDEAEGRRDQSPLLLDVVDFPSS